VQLYHHSVYAETSLYYTLLYFTFFAETEFSFGGIMFCRAVQFAEATHSHDIQFCPRLALSNTDTSLYFYVKVHKVFQTWLRRSLERVQFCCVIAPQQTRCSNTDLQPETGTCSYLALQLCCDPIAMNRLARLPQVTMSRSIRTRSGRRSHQLAGSRHKLTKNISSQSPFCMTLLISHVLHFRFRPFSIRHS
jgi:hypothetical protein